MYLKSLDIQGFKSFPDKLHLDFHKGMTAIVGPNGSGKSNIADAIRWVLGEQSTKTLRGSKMEDVIFAGTQGRKAVGYAEVSLTLDNSEHTLKTDYTEVTVTRRFYRSGESDFFINKKSVRLKDIHELFMDTGLGRDGYSIIGQGRIDEILSVRSDDRREVFDEAAGITKFRYRRDEAMKRLDAANENLVRVNDIINTLSEQLEPMRIKAEKERSYNTLFGELKGLEISLWLLRLDEIKAEYDRLTGEKNIIEYAIIECGEQLGEAYQEKERLSETKMELDRRHDTLRDEIRQTEAEAAAVSADVSIREAEIARNLRDMERLKEEAADYEQRKAAIDRSIDEKNAAIAALREKEMTLRQDIAALETRVAALDTQRAEGNGRLYAMEDQITALQEKLSASRIASSSLLASRTALQEQYDEIGQKDLEERKLLEDARHQLTLLDDSVEEKRQAKSCLMNMIAGYRLRLTTREKKYTGARTEYDERSRLIRDDENRLRILSDLEREYDGFNRSVKVVMRDAEHGALRGIHGPVSKLMQVEDTYVTAVETALGAGMQNIVVDREEDAKSAVEMLKRRDAGRATFLPITAVRGTELDDRDLRRERGYVGILSQLIGCDDVYRGIFRQLLGRTAVCETLDAAITLAKKNSYKFRIVTLDGQVINAGGAITGGSQNKSYGILSRANEIARLTESLSERKADMTAKETALRAMEQEMNAARYSLDSSEHELTTLETELAALEAQLTERKDRYRLMEESLLNADAVREELLGRIEALGSQLGTKTAEEGALQTSIDAVQGSMTAVQQEIGAIASQITAENERISGLRTALQESLLSIGVAESAVTELKSQLAGVDMDKSSRLVATGAFEEQNRILREELAALTLRSEELGGVSQALDAESAALTDEKFNIEAKRNQNDRTVQELSEKSLHLEKEKLRFENQLESVSRDQDAITAKLWDNYELTRTTAKELAIPIDDRKAAQKRADELRRKIKNLGSIYPGAIEEYEQTSEKYAFLTSQREDIEVSQKSLITIIDELTAEMKTLFSKQFKTINELFGQTFTELFGGGHAHLELSDPGDVLGSGIEIKVQPPGKALKVLSLLSGGEKAFVAIALYFAILKVRPTPFCVLDEIEAALDDVNVARYAKYLKQFNETQFIVITHRRGTMEEADVLYGVAMPIQGVSKVLSLDLSSVERELNMKL